MLYQLFVGNIGYITYQNNVMQTMQGCVINNVSCSIWVPCISQNGNMFQKKKALPATQTTESVEASTLTATRESAEATTSTATTESAEATTSTATTVSTLEH